MLEQNSLEVIQGTIENVVYQNIDNDYTVIEISDDKEQLITAVGAMPMVFEGEIVILTGSWTLHKDFGKQFSFVSYEKALPREVDDIFQYLSSSTVKGVGPVTALKIVNKFGVDTFDVIENHSEWLADIPGITLKKALIISDSFREQTGIRDVMMFFGEHISTSEVTRVYKKLGLSSVDIIKENPYILCDDEYSISFDKIDVFAKSIDFPLESPIRVLSASKYVLRYNANVNGHTCLPLEKLILAIATLIELPTALVDKLISEFISDELLCSFKIGDIRYVMTPEIYEEERYISKKLYQIDSDVVKFSQGDVVSLLEKMELEFGIQYAVAQKNAIYEALVNGVMILTGGPGTGKTTVVKALISIFKNLGIKTVLAAPTGRAAKRMSEATSADAKTIHRMLEMERSETFKIKFGRNAKLPLDEGVIIIDEASMMDLSLMYGLLSAIKKGARLILIGDKDQLPSVGAGNVFADLIASEKIKTVRLTEIFRQSSESLIITNAHRINNGDVPVLNSVNNDFFFVRREYERDIPETIADLVLKRLPKSYGPSIKEQIQIITPSKKGYGGVEILNNVLQTRINPSSNFKKEKSYHGTIFREGDKVMQTVNNYEIEWTRGSFSGMGIFNGDIGVIECINTVKNEVTVVFDDKVVTSDFELFEELDLAYAITVNKSQGSEYPVVIIPLYHSAPMLMTRNLFYTAVTRAKRMVILVGRSDIPVKMIENNKEILRYTTLKERISEYYG